MPNTERYILHILTYPIYNCGSSLLLHYSLLTHHAQHGSLFFSIRWWEQMYFYFTAFEFANAFARTTLKRSFFCFK